MSNIPVVKQNTSVVASMLKQNKVQETVGGGVAFLKFDSKRTGEWLFGPEGEGVTDEIFAVNLETLKHGQILWHNKKADRQMVAINQPLPEPQEPIRYTDAKGKPQVDDANEARSFEGQFEDGTIFLYETSTFGGRKCVDGLLAQLFARAAADSPFLFPQVKLGSSSYEHSSYGLVYQPELEAVAWYDVEGNKEPAEGEKLEAPAQEPKPKAKRKKKAAKVEEVVEEVEEDDDATPWEEEEAVVEEVAQEEEAKPAPRRRRRRPAA